MVEVESTGIREQVIKEITNFAKKYDVTKVVLFGSRAREDFKRTSDIDLAASGGNFDRFALDVNEETSTLLMFDIADLDEVSTPMRCIAPMDVVSETELRSEKISRQKTVPMFVKFLMSYHFRLSNANE